MTAKHRTTLLLVSFPTLALIAVSWQTFVYVLPLLAVALVMIAMAARPPALAPVPAQYTPTPRAAPPVQPEPEPERLGWTWQEILDMMTDEEYALFDDAGNGERN